MPLTGAAAARLYDDHVEAVHALVTRRVGPGDGGAVTAEVFEHAVRTWDRFDPVKGTERLFLFGAATVVLARHDDTERRYLATLRPDGRDGGAARDPLVGKATGGDGPTGTTDDTGPEDLVSRTMAAVSALPVDDRNILLLSLWEACSHAAIAEALDMSVGAVRSNLGRIRKDVKHAVVAAEKRASTRSASSGPPPIEPPPIEKAAASASVDPPSISEVIADADPEAPPESRSVVDDPAAHGSDDDAADDGSTDVTTTDTTTTDIDTDTIESGTDETDGDGRDDQDEGEADTDDDDEPIDDEPIGDDDAAAGTDDEDSTP